jgi:hypothetical protein
LASACSNSARLSGWVATMGRRGRHRHQHVHQHEIEAAVAHAGDAVAQRR